MSALRFASVDVLCHTCFSAICHLIMAVIVQHYSIVKPYATCLCSNVLLAPLHMRPFNVVQSFVTQAQIWLCIKWVFRGVHELFWPDALPDVTSDLCR